MTDVISEARGIRANRIYTSRGETRSRQRRRTRRRREEEVQTPRSSSCASARTARELPCRCWRIEYGVSLAGPPASHLKLCPVSPLNLHYFIRKKLRRCTPRARRVCINYVRPLVHPSWGYPGYNTLATVHMLVCRPRRSVATLAIGIIFPARRRTSSPP